jgi:hypothetical protein
MSDLEEQYERELEDYNEPGTRRESYEEPKGETDDALQKEFELEMEGYEEPKGETDPAVNELAQRFLELQERSFESYESRNAAIDGLLNEVEKQFFIGKLSKGVISSLLKKLAGSLVPGLSPLKAIKGAIALVRLAARQPLRGILLSAITANPQFAAARPLLKLLGIAETAENAENSLDSWNKFAKLSEYMYEHIIDNMPEAAVNDPVAANRFVSQAFESAASRIRGRTATRAYGRAKRYRFVVGPGERIHFDIIGKRRH